ncbi:DegT/DnrJ/EryC1/StrS family aminotransferase [Sphingomonas sp. MMS24-JH45]
MAQAAPGTRQALGFYPLLLPAGTDRNAVIAALAAEGVGAGAYFSPHLGEQPWVRSVACLTATPVADDLSRRILSLPLTDAMTAADAERATAALGRALNRRPHAVPKGRVVHDTIVIGSAAGTAFLTAAAKAGQLPRLAAELAIVERGPALSAGALGGYAPSPSDSSAETFLTALADTPHPEIASLADHPAAHRVAAHRGALMPLTEVGGLLDALGDRLGRLAVDHGASLLTGHEAVSVARAGGRWAAAPASPVGRGGGGAPRARHRRRDRRPPAARSPRHAARRRPVPRRYRHRPPGPVGRGTEGRRMCDGGGPARAHPCAADRGRRRVDQRAHRDRRAAEGRAAAGRGRDHPSPPPPAAPLLPLGRRCACRGFHRFRSRGRLPVSGFVYRLAGFRLEARDLVLRMLGIDGRVPDPRLRLHRIDGEEDALARATLREADLVVAALGYRPARCRSRGWRCRGAPAARWSTVIAACSTPPARRCPMLTASASPPVSCHGAGSAARRASAGRPMACGCGRTTSAA